MLYTIYNVSGLKDVRNGTWKLRKRLLKINNTISFDGFRMVLDENSYMDLSLFKQYLRYGEYEKEITHYLRNSLNPGETFVDVGANSGYYSLLASGIVGEQGMVLAFEPYKETFRRLIKNIQLNEANNVKAFNMALSSYDGRGTLNISRSSDGLNSLKTIPLVEDSIEIEVKKFDSVFTFKRNVDVIKIDAEGSELDIIKGASDSITNNKGIKIIFEINRYSPESQSTIDKLKAFGFISFTMESGKLSKQISNLEEIPTGTDNLVALRE